MASKGFLFAVVVVVATIAAPAIATQYIVGDDYGWTLNYDYSSWAAGKNFYVGDSLVFNYPAGLHNVLKVNATDSQSCNVPLTAEPLSSGDDVVTLATPGQKFYICGFDQHCGLGMNLAITVWPVAPESLSPAAAPGPSSWWW